MEIRASSAGASAPWLVRLAKSVAGAWHSAFAHRTSSLPAPSAGRSTVSCQACFTSPCCRSALVSLLIIEPNTLCRCSLLPRSDKNMMLPSPGGDAPSALPTSTASSQAIGGRIGASDLSSQQQLQGGRPDSQGSSQADSVYDSLGAVAVLHCYCRLLSSCLI
jgi:hypothetical protein